MSALFIGGQGWPLLRPAIAASPPAGTTIENQATGSFIDNADGESKTVLSDIVTLTVAEVAGITVTNSGVSGSTVMGGLAYFDFTITNVGNDPTQFFLPNAPSTIFGGTQAGVIQVISYDADGSGATAAVDLTSNNITIGGSGATTGTLLGSLVTANNGSLPANGTITIRVPITITGTGGSNVDVTMGDTPSNGQNQVYSSGNKDVYTVDNTNGTAGETDGPPLNGEREASSTQSLAVAITSNSTNTPTLTCSSDRRIFNSAYNGNGGVSTIGTDTYWDSAIGTASGPPPTSGWIDAYRTGNQAPGAWINSPYGDAGWISHFANTNHTAAGNPNIDIYFRYQFNLDPTVDVNSFQVAMDFFGDNSIADIFINGISQKSNYPTVLPQPIGGGDPYQFQGYRGTGKAALTLVNNWQTGANEIIIQVKSGVPLVGLVAQNVPSYLCKSDAGDAPISYGTAPHAILTSPKVYLGSVAPDADPFAGQPSPGANGDNTNGTGDEDTFTTALKAPISGTYNLSVPVHNTSSQSATLHAWIDFNQDGKFGVGEYQSVSVANNATTANLSWTVPSGTVLGSTYARFRITTSALADNTSTTNVDERSTLTANDGEVEDYPVTIVNNPNVLLVKRITAINGGTTTIGGDNLASYQDTVNPYDDNTLDPTLPNATYLQKDTTRWPTPSSFLLGGTNGGNVRKDDEMDYTIYFLSAGDGIANNVTICDLIPEKQSFVSKAYNSITPALGGFTMVDRGMIVFTNGTTTSFTNVADGDAGRYYAPGETLPNACKPSPTAPLPPNTNGAIVINLGNLPAATAPGLPIDSHGYIRFRVRID